MITAINSLKFTLFNSRDTISEILLKRLYLRDLTGKILLKRFYPRDFTQEILLKKFERFERFYSRDLRDFKEV